MELSVDQKIQAAIQPFFDKISSLQAENQLFKQQIAALQSAATNKQASKANHIEVPVAIKGTKKSAQHHEVKPQPKPIHKAGQKKQEVKAQEEENKVESTKAIGGKAPQVGSKPATSPNVVKDNNDTKNSKIRPITATKPVLGSVPNKSGLHEKKEIKKNTEVQQEKKQEGQEKVQEKQEQTSKEKDPKSILNAGLKNSGSTKAKPAEKLAEKKATAPPSQAPPNKKGTTGKSDPKSIIKGKAPKDEKQGEGKEETKVEQPHQQEQISDEVKVETLAMNSPYTPNDIPPKTEQPEKKQQVHHQEEKKEVCNNEVNAPSQEKQVEKQVEQQVEKQVEKKEQTVVETNKQVCEDLL